jgi:hypothetical protein
LTENAPYKGLPADHAFECRDLYFVLLKKIGRAGILIKGPSLKLLDPDSDQVARDVVAFGETVECLARNESGDPFQRRLTARSMARRFLRG